MSWADTEPRSTRAAAEVKTFSSQVGRGTREAIVRSGKKFRFQQQNTVLKLWPSSICEEKQCSLSAELFENLTSHDMICETIKISNHWFDYDKNI